MDAWHTPEPEAMLWKFSLHLKKNTKLSNELWFIGAAAVEVAVIFFWRQNEQNLIMTQFENIMAWTGDRNCVD